METARRTSEWQGEWQISEKLLYLKNMMVGKLNYELPIAFAASLCRKNCAIASQFNPFSVAFLCTSSAIFWGFRADKVFLLTGLQDQCRL
jgi:hypothetical protein